MTASESPRLVDGRQFDHLPIHHGFALAHLDSDATLDDPVTLAEVLSDLGALDLPCLVVAHPRLLVAAHRSDLGRMLDRLVRIPPLADDDLGALARRSTIVFTDSDILRERCLAAATPVVGLPRNTTWDASYPTPGAPIPTTVARP